MLIISITILFLTYTLHNLITYDFTLIEATKIALLRNQDQANNIMQDLDRYIYERMIDFQELAKLEQIKIALIEANQQFDPTSDLDALESQIELSAAMNRQTPVIMEILENKITESLTDFVSTYQMRYFDDAVRELFVTNQYGVVVAYAKGDSDYLQADEDWWQNTKNNKNFVEQLEFAENYNDYIVVFAYPILDDSSNYIGTLRIAVSLMVLLQDYFDDVDILQKAKKNVILLDKDGKPIYENGVFFPTDTEKEYFSRFTSNSGSFEFGSDNTTFVSYAKSIGYKDFGGFEWIVAIEQKSSVVDEFETLERNFLISSLIGIISAVILGLILSFFVTNPLRKLSKLTVLLGKGNFDTKIQKSKITEINSIIDSFNEMEVSLKKLFETEKKLAEANARIKNERLTAIGELAASMAHDLKNPLGTIRSGIDIIKRNSKTNNIELDEVIKRMDRAISRMSHQVEDVLNYVRVTPLDIKPVSVRSIINAAVQSIDIPKSIILKMDQNDVTINCDEKKMEVVFINLLLNSVQAIGEKEGTISIRFKKDGTNIMIEIEDTGSGVPEELVSEIFKPLVTTKQKGTGLGLASCKNIIEQHGGTISFHNNPTIFTITLPRIINSNEKI